MMNSKIVGDADALIALSFDEDALFDRALRVNKKLYDYNAQIIFPSTAITEAITTLLRKHSNPKLAEYLAKEYDDGIFRVEYVDKEIMHLAVDFFDPHGSKKNTFFDAIVAATAQKLHADAIFSFDKWYKKLDFTLVEDLKL